MDFAFFAAEDSWIMHCIYGGSQSSFLLLDCLCLAGTSPRGPWNAEVVHAKLLEARSRQRTRVVDALKKEINLMHNEKEFLAATFEFAHQQLLVQVLSITTPQVSKPMGK